MNDFARVQRHNYYKTRPTCGFNWPGGMEYHEFHTCKKHKGHVDTRGNKTRHQCECGKNTKR